MREGNMDKYEEYSNRSTIKIINMPHYFYHGQV